MTGVEKGQASLEPEAVEVIGSLEERLGEDGMRALVTDCLRVCQREHLIQVINASLGTVRLSAGTDRGRMSRMLLDGLRRRRPAVLEVLQTLSRHPFESTADPACRERLDQAADTLNEARRLVAPPDSDKKKEAATQVVGVLREVLEPSTARRLILLNVFPDTLDLMLEALAASADGAEGQ